MFSQVRMYWMMIQMYCSQLAKRLSSIFDQRMLRRISSGREAPTTAVAHAIANHFLRILAITRLVRAVAESISEFRLCTIASGISLGTAEIVDGLFDHVIDTCLLSYVSCT